MASKTKNSSKLNRLYWILVIALILLAFVIWFYFNEFGYLKVDTNTFGTFGDFVGGVLNPLFALFSLFAIIYTIKIQAQELEYSREELEATREELEKSRVAQEEQSKSLQLQNKATKLQMFENTFFQLLNIFNIIKSRIRLDIKLDENNPFKITSLSLKKGSYHSVDTMYAFLEILKKSYNSYDEFNEDFEKYTGSYFGHLYQIIKFIDNSPIKDKQRYINIFRAQFTKDELELLFYHCLGSIGKRKFKLLIEKYEFFEHITHNEDIDKPINEYDIRVFGNNMTLREKHKDYSKS